MIISMTGFGKGAAAQDGFDANIEIRSVNHRFLDISVKLPRSFETYEGRIRELVRERIDRGRLNINIVIQEPEGSQLGLRVNAEAVKAYTALLESLRKAAGITEPLKLEYLLTFSDVFSQNGDDTLPEAAWHATEAALQQAIDSLDEMRRREGAEMEKDLLRRVQVLSEKIEEIERLSLERCDKEFTRLKERLFSMVQGGELDASRLEMEVALIAERTDVTEECIRFRSHNTLFIEAIRSDIPAGRKLNFLLQEMNREANTIGAKACDSEIAHRVVEIKEEVEKLREQIQNIE